MSIGTIFYVIALILFFLAGIGTFTPGLVWGLFSLCLGLLLSGTSIPLQRNP